MVMDALVSVIIPTHKGHDIISRAVDSVIKQTYKKIEIIVVDDNGLGSDEQQKTRAAIADYIDSGCVKYIPHEINKNGSAARNTGVRESKGKYITLLDDDDIYYPNKVEDEVNCLESLPEDYGLVYCSIDLNYGDCTRTKHAIKSGTLLKELLYHSLVIGSDTLMVRKKSYEEIGGFDESFRRHQDFEFTARMASKWKIKAIDKVGVLSYEIGRNIPRSKDLALEYRHHYIKKMMPLIETLPLISKRQVISSNFVMLYGPELRGLKLKNTYLNCKNASERYMKHYTLFTFLLSIVVIEKNKLFNKIRNELSS